MCQPIIDYKLLPEEDIINTVGEERYGELGCSRLGLRICSRPDSLHLEASVLEVLDDPLGCDRASKHSNSR